MKTKKQDGEKGREQPSKQTCKESSQATKRYRFPVIAKRNEKSEERSSAREAIGFLRRTAPQEIIQAHADHRTALWSKIEKNTDKIAI